MGGDFEDRTAGPVKAFGTGPAHFGGSIEVAVATLHQHGLGISAVAAVGLRAKAVEHGERSARGDLEDRAAAVVADAVAILVGSAPKSRSVEIAVAGVQQPGFRIGAVAWRSLKVVERGQDLCRRRNGGRGAEHEEDASHLQQPRFVHSASYYGLAPARTRVPQCRVKFSESFISAEGTVIRDRISSLISRKGNLILDYDVIDSQAGGLARPCKVMGTVSELRLSYLCDPAAETAALLCCRCCGCCLLCRRGGRLHGGLGAASLRFLFLLQLIRFRVGDVAEHAAPARDTARR